MPARGGGFQILKGCGAEGNRTPVQTYSSKAFYMLILVLIVGKWQEPVEPNISLAAYSLVTVTAFGYCSPFYF